MAQATHCLSSCDAGGNDGRQPSPKPKSLDYRSRHELDWSDIEDALHKISIHAMAVEMVGRSARDNIHGETLDGVFDLLSEEIVGQIKQLEALLGLNDEGAL